MLKCSTVLKGNERGVRGETIIMDLVLYFFVYLSQTNNIMDIRTLNIGSWIHNPEGEITVVKELTETTINGHTLDKIEPVEIDPDLLNKLHWGSIINDKGKFTWQYGKLRVTNKNGKWWANTIQCKFMHEIQFVAKLCRVQLKRSTGE